jgi:uncharacterized membrane-anchored protein YhcB (DUF1043 family)
VRWLMPGSVRGTLIGWFAAAILLVGVGALVGAFIAQRPGAESAALQLRSDRLAQSLVRSEFEAQLQAAQSRIEQAQSEIAIERAARAELEKNLADSQRDLGRLKDHLAFYEQLLPPGPQGAIDLRAVYIAMQGRALSYRVLLMRSGKPGERFSGRLEFVALGRQKNKEVTHVLSALQSASPINAGAKDAQTTQMTGDASSELLKLDFEQFQRLQGMLALPAGFEPQSVTVRVLDGDIVLASRRVDL